MPSGLKLRVRNENLIFLFLSQNICCGYSKEPSQLDGSFENPKHMLKLMGKKIFTILRRDFCLSKPVVFMSCSSCYCLSRERWCLINVKIVVFSFLSSIHLLHYYLIDTITIELPIVHFKGSQVVSKLCCTSVPIRPPNGTFKTFRNL